MALRWLDHRASGVPPTGETGLAIHHSLYAAGPAKSIIPGACGAASLGRKTATVRDWKRWVKTLGGSLVKPALAHSSAPAAPSGGAYSRALFGEFQQWDDVALLIDNPGFRGLSWAGLRWMFTTHLMGHYMPLTWVTYGLDHAVWGLKPFGYHVTNVALHGANTVLVYFLALRLVRVAWRHAAEAGEDRLRIGAGSRAGFRSSSATRRVGSVDHRTPGRAVWLLLPAGDSDASSGGVRGWERRPFVESMRLAPLGRGGFFRTRAPVKVHGGHPAGGSAGARRVPTGPPSPRGRWRADSRSLARLEGEDPFSSSRRFWLARWPSGRSGAARRATSWQRLGLMERLALSGYSACSICGRPSCRWIFRHCTSWSCRCASSTPGSFLAAQSLPSSPSPLSP